MKKVMLVLLVVSCSIFIIGCKKDKKENNPVTNPVSTLLPSVVGSVDISSPFSPGNTYASLMLLGTDLSRIVDATFTVNGTVIPSDSGMYSKVYNSSITTGSTVNLNITSSDGNFSASGVMPASGMAVAVKFPGTSATSQIVLQH